jgi:hypothetical protein
MSFNYDQFFNLLIEQLYRSSSNITEDMAVIISDCEQLLPHAGWQLLREIDYETDLQILKNEWLQRALIEKPSDFIIQGIWIGIVNYGTENDEYSDMYFSAGTLCNDEKLDMNWTHQLQYFPKAGFANSSALRSIYKIAKDIGDAESDSGNHYPSTDFGHVAEYTCCLSYAAFAVKYIFQEVDSTLISNGGQSSCIAVGFDSGDALFLGRLTPDNFDLDAKLLW